MHLRHRWRYDYRRTWAAGAAVRMRDCMTCGKRQIVGPPLYEFIGPRGVNGFAPHAHEGRRHAHDGGADPHAHPMFDGDDRDSGGDR